MNMKERRAFTLIELLTVIAIIVLLAGLLFPAIKSALLKAEIGKAQTQIAGLETAFKSYYTEYGKWPVAVAPSANIHSNYTFTVDTNLVALLQGFNNTESLTTYGNGYPPSTAPTHQGDLLQGNPHQIHFLEFKKADVDPVLGYLDPWKQPYYCRFDLSYVNDVNDPFTGSVINPNKVTAGFLIWSAGPNSQYDDKDTATGADALNKDNVKSW